VNAQDGYLNELEDTSPLAEGRSCRKDIRLPDYSGAPVGERDMHTVEAHRHEEVVHASVAGGNSAVDAVENKEDRSSDMKDS